MDKGALKLFELVEKSDLEGLVVKRKDGKYAQQTLWYKILNPTYMQKSGRQDFFHRQ
jgi:ATP-dependent DNA ligase